MKKKITIEDENEIDWEELWTRKMDKKGDRGKDWTKAAVKYSERASKDNYTEQLISKMILSKEDTVLDVGCGEGSVTIPLSKEVSSVTAIDATEKMLEILDEKIKEESIDNIKTIKDDVNDVTLEKYGNHDIVLASRVINGIKSPRKVFSNFNEIANKYVFITLFGPNNWKLEKDFFNLSGRFSVRCSSRKDIAKPRPAFAQADSDGFLRDSHCHNVLFKLFHVDFYHFSIHSYSPSFGVLASCFSSKSSFSHLIRHSSIFAFFMILKRCSMHSLCTAVFIGKSLSST